MGGLRKILLVEDNGTLSDIFKYFLEDHGFDIKVAADGEEGLEKARQHQPDLVFLDIMLPKISGIDVLGKLRGDPQYNCTKSKIVLLTNLGDATKIAPGVEKEIDGYVIKADIELKDLLEIIESLQSKAS